MALPPIDSVYLTGDFLQELKNGNPSVKLAQPAPMLRFLYELSWSIVHEELPFQKCKAALDAVQFSDKASDEDLSSNFADIVSQMALDLTLPREIRARLVKLARWLVESELVPLRFFQERCEEEFLWEAEMVKIKAQDLKSKEVRVNTRLLYQQTKFNLLREESEGYAKLVTLLCQGSETCSQTQSASTVGYIKSLIGHFDLDPNRVFDIVLECFELQPHSSLFLELIPLFPKSHASQILGFKFQYYQRSEVTTPVPFGLYQLTALLVKENFIDLDSIYVHLVPKDEDAFDLYSVFSAKRLDEANKIGKINLAATGKDLMDDEKPGDVTVNLYTAVDMEVEAVGERFPELENNQTLGLLAGFLSVDDWYHANLLFDRLSLLNPVAHMPICDGLFRLIEKSISSAYDIIRQRQFQYPISSSSIDVESMNSADSFHHRLIIALRKEVFEMLLCAGAYLYRDILLLQKVCLVLKDYHLSAIELTCNGTRIYRPEFGDGDDYIPRLHLKEVRLRIEDALGSCLLPSLQLIPANPAVGHMIWEVMSLLPYEVRYRLYGEWEKDDERNPMILAARQTAKLDTRRLLKRLAKENLKQLGRMVAKLAHANPMTVLRTIVHQIEAYRDMITPVVDAFKYLTQLEYDVLEYVVIERLAQGGRDKIKDDGLNLSDWLQSLAAFWGHLCKKYPSMELRGLFQYLVNELKKGHGFELILVQELIQQMANVQYTENMTDEQLDAMSGGETLRYQATSFGVTRNNKALIKSTNRLRDSLLPKEEPKLAVPLLLLIAQHRSVIIINANAPYIKMVSEQFDRCHGILLQYVEFLSSAVTPATSYAQLIPSLHDLVHLYHLEPEVAFLIYRPVMRLFKCRGRTDVCWPLIDHDALSSSTNPDDLILEISSEKSSRWSDLLNTVRTMLPSKAWNSLSPDLYATFWGLSLYDLYVPRSRYESEISKQHAALKALEELSDNSSSAIAKRKKDKERIQDSLDRLANELKRHEQNVDSVRRRLALEKDKWLSSCPDTLKINMEFLQRCIFPRCTFSMPDAVYCAMFVHTLHSLGTPFFNTVNHIDVLICKTLHPMICCCTEYEAGRLGRFLYETLKIAYHWKSDETIYESECGNMPGFAVYYRFPNSQRVTYAQFIKVHWKWSQRITRLLIQCLESTEYMEIRNSLIMLTKVSSVFPVTRKSGINIEKRVAKIKGDDREDLKVLATGVAAALAARKPSWVTEEEFGMGYLELKPAPSLASKSLAGNGPGVGISQGEPAGGKVSSQGAQSERAENVLGNAKGKGGSVATGPDLQSVPSAVQGGPSNKRQANEPTSKNVDENTAKVGSKTLSDCETRPAVKRSQPSGSLTKPPKQELAKEEPKLGKVAGRTGSSSSERDHPVESRHMGATTISSTLVTNGNTGSAPSKSSAPSTRILDGHGRETRTESGSAKSSELRGSIRDDNNEVSDVPRHSSSRSVHSPRHDSSAKAADKLQKRASSAEEPDRINKRRKGESDGVDSEVDVRLSDREKAVDARLSDKSHPTDFDKLGAEEQTINRALDKHVDRLKDKSSEKYDRDHREKMERIDKPRGDDILVEKSRDRSMERYARERSVEKMYERGIDRNFERHSDKVKDDRNKDDRGKLRYNDLSLERGHVDDRLFGQNLPPPPPLPPHVVPHSVSRRDEDADRRFGTNRHPQRLSPRHEEKELRRSEESLLIAQDDARRRREDEFRDRKRDDRDLLTMKMEEREREKERERERERERLDEMDVNAASKRRKLKREHPAAEPGEYSPGAPPPHPLSIGVSQSYDLRERGERKGSMVQRSGYFEEPGMRIHGKEAPGKMARRDIDPIHDRDYDDDKRQRVEPKRRHRK